MLDFTLLGLACYRSDNALMAGLLPVNLRALFRHPSSPHHLCKPKTKGIPSPRRLSYAFSASNVLCKNIVLDSLGV